MLLVATVQYRMYVYYVSFVDKTITSIKTTKGPNWLKTAPHVRKRDRKNMRTAILIMSQLETP